MRCNVTRFWLTSADNVFTECQGACRDIAIFHEIAVFGLRILPILRNALFALTFYPQGLIGGRMLYPFRIIK